MYNKNVLVSVNGTIKEKITIDEANERKKIFSPLSIENTYYNELKDTRRSIKTTNYGTSFDLDGLIDYLQKIRSKIGNMDVLFYNGNTKTFTRPSIMDIDVVKKHFIISSNLKNINMEIKNNNALSFFHC